MVELQTVDLHFLSSVLAGPGREVFFSASRRQPFPLRATVPMDNATVSAGFRQEESAAFFFQMGDWHAIRTIFA